MALLGSRRHRHHRHHGRRVIIIIIIIFFVFFLSSNRPSGLLRATAISLGVSQLPVFLCGRSEALVLVVWSVPFFLYALDNYFCKVSDLNLCGIRFKMAMIEPKHVAMVLLI